MGDESRQKRSDGAWDRIPSGGKAARAAPLGIRGELQWAVEPRFAPLAIGGVLLVIAGRMDRNEWGDETAWVAATNWMLMSCSAMDLSE